MPARSAAPSRRFCTRAADWDLKVIDAHEEALREVAAAGIVTEALDITDAVERRRVIDGVTAVISALPYDLNGPLAESAKDAGAHYFDLTEDVESMRHVKALAPDARSAIMPQCGLAPGFHFDCCARSGAPVRLSAFDPDARRRAPTIPGQRPDVQPDLEHGRADQ